MNNACIVDGWNVLGYNGPMLADRPYVLLASKYMDDDYEVYVCFENEPKERFLLHKNGILVKSASRCSELMAYADKEIDGDKD